MTDKQEPLVITFSGEMPKKRQMVFQVGVSADATLAVINTLLDKCRVAFERQTAFGELEIFQLELEQQEKQAADHAKRLHVVEENVYKDWNNGQRRGELKLSHKQELEKQQAHENAAAIKARIEKVHAWIAEAKAKIAG